MFERIWNRKHAQDQTTQDSEPEKQSANAEGGLSRNQPQRMNAGPHPNPGKLIMPSPPSKSASDEADFEGAKLTTLTQSRDVRPQGSCREERAAEA